MRFRAAFVGWLAFGATLVFASPVLAYRFGEPAVRATGPAETVFDWSTTACEQNDIPDNPARAFRDAAGKVQLIASHAVVRREVGPDLNSVQHQCQTIMNSHANRDPAAYDDREWLSSVYTTDGQTIYGLSHHEYEGWNYDQGCAQWRGTFEQAKCWTNSVNLVKSVNGGSSYSHAAAPSHLVAGAPYRYATGAGPLGVFDPSNIIYRPSDGHYYATVRVEAHGAQQRGICLMRTSTLSDATSWRAWDGTGFGVRFINPYFEPDEPPSAHVCQPLSPGNLPYGNSSLAYSSYLGKYVFVAVSEKTDPASGNTVGGFYYSVSDDLIHWSEQELLMEGVLTWRHQCGDADPVLYPSLLDPSSSDRNFGTIGHRPYLYFTRFNYEYWDADTCWMTLDRDLLRIPIEFTDQSPPPPVPPETTITSGPTGLTASTTATFAFSSDPGTTFRCRLDGPGTIQGSYSTCSAPKTYSGLAEGAYQFLVFATDGGGTQDPTPATASFTVDTTAPATSIETGPVNPTNETTAAFAFSSNEPGATFRCRLDAEAFASCSSPATYSGLPDGPHTFTVEATDSAGNTDSAGAATDWVIDTGLPQATIDSGPARPTSSTSASFTFSSNEPGATFDCQLDGGSWSACSSGESLAGLTEGSHAFSVRARDTAGNLDPVPATRTWTVDLTAPETMIDSGPSGTTEATPAGFAFSSSEDGSTFECKLDVGLWEPCASPRTYAGLAHGPHVFAVRSRDQAGNLDQTDETRSWTIRPAAPATVAPSPSPSTPVADPFGPSPAAAADSVPPAFSARVKHRRRIGTKKVVVVEVGCMAEACTASARGKISIAGSARVFKLRPAGARVAKGGRGKLRLRLPRTALRALSRALERHERPGGARVTVRVSVTDAAGNRSTRGLTVP